MFSELIGICTLPQLLQDIEDNAIHKDNFVEFTKILEINFPVLLDLLSSPAFIQELCDEEEHDTLLLRQKLILLMCEHAPITPNTIPPYTIDNSELFGNLRRICLSHLTSGPLLTQCMDIYKQQLLDNKWKRSMGTCYGFVYFCDLFTNSPDNQVDLQSILFILSIASQFIDCIHGEIRLLGLRLYAIILTQCPRQQILETNVHKVIIKSCLDNSQKLLAEDCLLLLWTCVTQAVCLDDQRLLKDLNWNEVDDSLHLLFQKIKLESNRALRQKLRSLLQAIVIKCVGEPAAGELLATSDLLQVQQEIHSRAIKNVKLFRWLRDFKELFIFECLSVSNSVESTKEALLVSQELLFLSLASLYLLPFPSSSHKSTC